MKIELFEKVQSLELVSLATHSQPIKNEYEKKKMNMNKIEYIGMKIIVVCK